MTADHHRRRARPPTAAEKEASTGRVTDRYWLAALDWGIDTMPLEDADTMPLDDLVDDLGDALLPLKDTDLLVLDGETVAVLDDLGRAPVDELLRPSARPVCKRGEAVEDRENAGQE